jgi:hypothetical protein
MDERIDERLRHEFPSQSCQTARYAKLADLRNVRLLSAPEADGFEVMITVDREIPYQQNMATRQLGVLISPLGAHHIMATGATAPPISPTRFRSSATPYDSELSHPGNLPYESARGALSRASTIRSRLHPERLHRSNSGGNKTEVNYFSMNVGPRTESVLGASCRVSNLLALKSNNATKGPRTRLLHTSV